MTEFNKGDRVRFTCDNLGAQSSPNQDGRMTNTVVGKGDTGTYYGPLEFPSTGATENWHYVSIAVKEDEFEYVPAHESMFEKAGYRDPLLTESHTWHCGNPDCETCI